MQNARQAFRPRGERLDTVLLLHQILLPHRERVMTFCHPSGGSVSELCLGGQGPSFSNADLAPTLSQLSPLFRGRRPA